MRNYIVTIGGRGALAVLMPVHALAQAEKIDAGKKVYTAQKCQTCHAIGGTGGKMSSALDGVGSKLTAAGAPGVDRESRSTGTAIFKPAPKMKMKKYVTFRMRILMRSVTYLSSLKKVRLLVRESMKSR